MDSVVAEVERRLEAYDDPIEVSVLGCAVNGIGEASHADFGITGAKDEGLIFAHGKPLRKIPQEELVETLFEEIDKSLGRGGEIEVDDSEAAEGAEWLRRIEEENAGDLTPEKLAALEKAAAEQGEDITAPGNGDEPYLKPVRPKGKKVELGEEASPTAGRRFTRA
jgi:(E)-4-hydroxy-3-methylbut-2-enyl-diphosphate synthase